jgi:anti-sigma B factor antagonist
MSEFNIDVLPGRHDGVRILRITGALTLKTLFDFQQQLRAEPSAATIIDLSGVPYLDSAALGALLGFHVSCERGGRPYALAGATERLENIFHVTHVDNILRCSPSVEDAEKTLQAPLTSGL